MLSNQQKKLKSKFEEEIYLALKIIYPWFTINRQKRLTDFGNCGKELSRTTLDFYINELSMAIEVDGEHHYMPVSYGNDELAIARYERKVKLDKLKDAFLQEQGIKLLRFSTEELKQVDDLAEFLKERTTKALEVL